MGHSYGSASGRSATDRYRRATSRKRLRSPSPIDQGSSASEGGDQKCQGSDETGEGVNRSENVEGCVGTVTELTMEDVENVVKDNAHCVQK